MQFWYTLQSLGHLNYLCNLRLQYCTKTEKESLLKLDSGIFIFRKKVFPTDRLPLFFRGSPETRCFFFWPNLFSGFSLIHLLYKSYSNMPIKWPNVSRMYQGCQICWKQCIFIVMGCSDFEVHVQKKIVEKIWLEWLSYSHRSKAHN